MLHCVSSCRVECSFRWTAQPCMNASAALGLKNLWFAVEQSHEFHGSTRTRVGIASLAVDPLQPHMFATAGADIFGERSICVQFPESPPTRFLIKNLMRTSSGLRIASRLFSIARLMSCKLTPCRNTYSEQKISVLCNCSTRPGAATATSDKFWLYRCPKFKAGGPVSATTILPCYIDTACARPRVLQQQKQHHKQES